MSKLKEIEKKILELKREVADRGKYMTVSLGPDLKDELEILESKRQFILDTKEPLWEKIAWNIITPIIVAVVITIITNKWLI
jgi:hypothetical protein